eukprot:847449_1
MGGLISFISNLFSSIFNRATEQNNENANEHNGRVEDDENIANWINASAPPRITKATELSADGHIQKGPIINTIHVSMEYEFQHINPDCKSIPQTHSEQRSAPISIHDAMSILTIGALSQTEISSPREIWHVYITAHDSQTIEITASPYMTVRDLKMKIYDSCGVKITAQRLLFHGKQIENKNTLAQYNISNESTLDLVLSLDGGMFNNFTFRS